MTLERLLFLLGAGFLVANLRALYDLAWHVRRRETAVVVWPSRRPPFFGVMMLIGAALGVLLVSNFATGNVTVGPMFGEGMMFAYYACVVPLSRRVRRGFYADGIWTDSRFVPYSRIGGLSWREGQEATLILIVAGRSAAFRLAVPGGHYGAARRVLRDKIAEHAIHYAGTGLDLGAHDEREDV
jgi:hypothetical protein